MGSESVWLGRYHEMRRGREALGRVEVMNGRNRILAAGRVSSSAGRKLVLVLVLVLGVRLLEVSSEHGQKIID